MKKAFKTILFTTLTLAMVFSIVPATVQARANIIVVGANYADNPNKTMEGIQFGLFNGDVLVDSQSLNEFGGVEFSWAGPMENLSIHVLDSRGYFTARTIVPSRDFRDVPGVLPFFHYGFHFTSAVPAQTAEVSELRVHTIDVTGGGQQWVGNIQFALYNNNVRIETQLSNEERGLVTFEWIGPVGGLDVRLLDSRGLSSEHSIVPFADFRRVTEFATVYIFHWHLTSDEVAPVEEVAPPAPTSVVPIPPATPVTTPALGSPVGTILQVDGSRLLVNNQQVGTIRTYAGQQLFPLRSTAEALGATVVWQPNGTVIVTTADGYPTVLTVGSYQIFDERAYVPRNFFAVMLRTNIIG